MESQLYKIIPGSQVFICSTITPNILASIKQPELATFGSMVYNLESIFGCGFARGTPVEMRIRNYTPLFLEAARRCEKTKTAATNEINFCKEVFTLLGIIDDVNTMHEEEKKAATLKEKKFDSKGFYSDYLAKYLIENIDNEAVKHIIERFNTGETKIICDKLKSLKQSCTPVVDLAKNYTSRISEIVREKLEMQFQEKNQDSFVRDKILALLEESTIAVKLKEKITNFAKGNSYTNVVYEGEKPTPQMDALAEDAHRNDGIAILRILTGNDGLKDTYIQPDDYIIKTNKKMCEWLAKNIPYLQYKNQEDLMHLSNFLYCSEYGYNENYNTAKAFRVADLKKKFEGKNIVKGGAPIELAIENAIEKDFVKNKKKFFSQQQPEQVDQRNKENFFPESKKDFERMNRNLKHFLEILESDSGFKTTKDYTLIHDCELGDANAVLLFRYLQKMNPQNKFRIIMQVSNKYKAQVESKDNASFFYHQLVVDNSHDQYNINNLICGDGNFENSLSKHANGKLAFLNEGFYSTIIPKFFPDIMTEDANKFEEEVADEAAEAIYTTPIGKNYIGGKNKRHTKRRRHTKKRRHTKRRRYTKRRKHTKKY